MNPNVELFLQKAAANPELEKRLQATTSEKELQELILAEGFSFDMAELREALSTISDEELDSVAGGGDIPSMRYTPGNRLR